MKKTLVIAALSVAFAGTAFAQAKPAPNPQLTACRVQLDKDYKALVKDHDEGVKAGKMSKGEEAEYKTTMDALKTKWVEAMKDGANLKECTDQVAGIKTAQARLNEMQAVNGKVHACFNEFKKVSADSDKVFADGVAKKAIDAKEATEYKAREVSLQRQYDAAMKSGKVTQKECDGLLASAKSEHAAVLKMVAAPAANSSPAACVAEFTKVSAESDKIFADGVAKKTIDPKEAAEYKKIDVALQATFNKANADKKITLAECNGILKSANAQKAAVTKMVSVSAPVAATGRPVAAVPPAVQACLAQFKTVSAQADKLIEDGTKAGKVTAQEAAVYKTRDTALQRQYDAAMKDGNMTIAECNGLVASATQERTMAQSFAAR